MYRPAIDVAGRTTLALCDALTAVDPELRLGDQVDYLPVNSMREIDRALAVLLALPAPKA